MILRTQKRVLKLPVAWYYHVIFTAVFALVFINLYSPFGINTWYNLTRPQLFFYSSLVILTGMLIIALSRIIMHQVSRKRPISHGTYILWIAAEIVSLALVHPHPSDSNYQSSGRCS